MNSKKQTGGSCAAKKQSGGNSVKKSLKGGSATKKSLTGGGSCNNKKSLTGGASKALPKVIRCMKCKKPMPAKNVHSVSKKTKIRTIHMAQGVCAKCGTKVSRIIGGGSH
jgi:hypothetical protein